MDLFDFPDYDAESFHQKHPLDVACDVSGLCSGFVLSRN